MSAFRMHHLHVICEDLEGMVKFWTQGLGASFVEYRAFGGAEGAVTRLDGLQVNLRVPKEAEKGIGKNSDSLGYDHLGLEVDDLDAACSGLADFGCTIETGPVDLGEVTIVFLKGPENMRLELIQKN